MRIDKEIGNMKIGIESWMIDIVEGKEEGVEKGVD